MNIDLGYLATVFAVILLSMTLHEAMHAYVGYWLGDNTAKNEGRLSLNPIKHIDPVLTLALPIILAVIGAPIFGAAKPVPFNPHNIRYGAYGAALIGVAGPLTNLVLSFVFFALYALLGMPVGFVGTFFNLAVIVNLGFFIFNMIPIPPLDGSRLLYALAPDGVRRVMEMMEQYGLILVFIVIFFASSLIGQFMSTVMRAILQFYGSIFGVHVI